MTVKTFFYGLIASFGIPWLVMLAIPFGSMRSLEAPQYDEAKDEKVGTYQTTHSGRIRTGSMLYAKEGCATCHTMVTRPTYAGNDVFRDGQGGFKNHPDKGDTRRITNAFDFVGEDAAQIGETRIGPDLGNFGSRMDFMAAEYNAKLAKELGVDVSKLGAKAFNKELYVYKHLYDPSVKAEAQMKQTNCPKNSRLFDECGAYGQGAPDAVHTKGQKQTVPNDRGRAITSYLLNLKRDGEVPAHMQYARDKKEAGK